MCNVLIIDDDYVSSVLLMKMIDLHVHRVDVVSELGAQLLDYSHISDAYDLIFVDLFMPGISGPEILNQIKSYNPNTPVIAYSGDVDGTLSKFDDKLQKPIQGKNLFTILNKYVKMDALSEI